MISTLGVWVKRLLLLALFIILLVFFVDFTLSNKQSVSLDFLGLTLSPVSSATVVVISFVSGGVLGLLASIMLVTRLRLANASLRRKLKRRETELHTLRANALKGLTDA